MITKEQAQAAKTKLQASYPGISFGIGKSGEDYTVVARSTDLDALYMVPSMLDGVKVLAENPGPIKAL